VLLFSIKKSISALLILVTLESAVIMGFYSPKFTVTVPLAVTSPSVKGTVKLLFLRILLFLCSSRYCSDSVIVTLNLYEEDFYPDLLSSVSSTVKKYSPQSWSVGERTQVQVYVRNRAHGGRVALLNW
jgi:hypothetical protein